MGEGLEHGGILGAVDRLHDAVLKVDGEAFVDPEVVPGAVGHQVARPGMRQLVGDQGDQRAVARNDGRRQEGQARIFHAAKGEGGRQDEQVVALPLVGPIKSFGRLNEGFCLAKFPSRSFKDGGFGVHTGAWTRRLETQIADRQGHQVGGDGLLHFKAVAGIFGKRLWIRCAHDG